MSHSYTKLQLLKYLTNPLMGKEKMNFVLAPAFSLPPASAPPLVAVMAGLEGTEDVVVAEGVAARAINKCQSQSTEPHFFSGQCFSVKWQ